MRILGSVKKDAGKAKSMAEIRLICTPYELRTIAYFLLKQADSLQEFKDDYGHEHLQDDWAGWKKQYGDIIVLNQNVLFKNEKD